MDVVNDDHQILIFFAYLVLVYPKPRASITRVNEKWSKSAPKKPKKILIMRLNKGHKNLLD